MGELSRGFPKRGSTLRRASQAASSPLRVVRIENMTWLMVTRAARPYGLPYAPRIPAPIMLSTLHTQARRTLAYPNSNGYSSCFPVLRNAAIARATCRASSTSLQPICTSAGKHFVDTDDVVRMETHTDVEVVFAHTIDHVLVRCNTGSF